MKKRALKRTEIAVCFLILLTGAWIFLKKEGPDGKQAEHEPLTILTAGLDYQDLQDLIAEQCPKIRFEYLPYDGGNISKYIQRLFETGNLPDLVCTIDLYDADLQKENLIDLSGYPFTGNYNIARLKESDINGELYLLPMGYSVRGIVYNKTLFQKHGWQVPHSFEELAELVPQIKKAGVRLSLTNYQYAWYNFQYFYDIAETCFFGTPEGKVWQQKFLAGTETMEGNLEPVLDCMKKWIDLGMFGDSREQYSDSENRRVFEEGNTAFLISGGSQLLTQNTDGSGDQYAVMPWLSENGENNKYLTNVNRYFGLNKKLAEPGNEQKLEDALEVMQILSTREGQSAFAEDNMKNCILPLENSTILPDSPYYELKKELDSGKTFHLVYSDWQNLQVLIGEKVMELADGTCTEKEFIKEIDRQNLTRASGNEAEVYGIAKEDLSNEETARLIGAVFLCAADADAALISRGTFEKVNSHNKMGVNGQLFQGEITEEILGTVLPTGLYGTISVLDLTGKEIKELYETGYEAMEDGCFYPYCLVSGSQMEFKEKQTYQVVIQGCPKQYEENGDLKDSGICGMDAMKKYLSELKSIDRDSYKMLFRFPCYNENAGCTEERKSSGHKSSDSRVNETDAFSGNSNGRTDTV